MNNDRVEVRLSRAYVFFWALLAIPACIASYNSMGWSRVFGLVISVVLILLALYLLRDVFRYPGAVLVIDRFGFLDRRLSDQKIPWDTVVCVERWQVDSESEEKILVQLTDFSALQLATKLSKENVKGIELGSVLISTQALAMRSSDLLKSMVRFKAEWDTSVRNK